MKQTNYSNYSKNIPKHALFAVVGAVLQVVSLSVMGGGMLALGAFTAPMVFKTLPREQAAPLMALIFTRFDVVLQLALIGAWLGEILRRFGMRTFALKGLADKIRLGVFCLLTISLLYATLVVNPQIGALNRAGVHRQESTVAGRRFEQAHRLSERLYKLDLLCVIVLLMLTAGSLAYRVHPEAERT